MIMLCFLLSLRAGSYGVTTRPRDKWITTYYAYRTEINSVTIVVARRGTGEEENGWEGGRKKDTASYPDGIVDCENAGKGQ